MISRVDLRELAAVPGATMHRPVRRVSLVVIATRYVLPALLLAGCVGVLGWSLSGSFMSRTPVEVIPVLVLRTGVEASDTPLFQAAGWIEPRPTSITVSAIEEGVVERMNVIEGQSLDAGEVIAMLVDADARLAVREAEAELQARTAEVASAEANAAAAKSRLREPLERISLLAEAEATLARVESELARIPSQLRSAEARAALARKELESRTQSGGAVSRLALARSQADVEAGAAAIAELEAQQEALRREQLAQSDRVRALRRQLELKTEETRAAADTTAQLELAKARQTHAAVVLEKSQLRLSRMTIRAPQAGRVLSLDARPGTKVMGLKPAASADASTVITMYAPRHLQVRADVRLEDLPRVRPGQPVTIATAAVNGALRGEVIAATSLTDIQKNTVQVKVAIREPPEVLKPDMLVQVAFLTSPSKAGTKSSASLPARLVVPADLPRMQDGRAVVWLADRTSGTARRRTVQLGGTTPAGLREVVDGLAPGDRLIVNPSDSLKDGQPVTIREQPPGQAKPQ